MQKLKVSLKDCYGIGKLDHIFDFDVHPGTGHDNPEYSKTNIVYARNGVMKTSFAKTLLDYSNNEIPSDTLYGRTSSVSITADGALFPNENVCVLQSNDQYFESDKMAILLSNQKDQKRYAEIMSEIQNASDRLFGAVGKSMKIRGGAEKAKEVFDNNFNSNNYNQLIYIMSMQNEVKNAKEELLAVNYAMLDKPAVASFLEKTQTRTMIKDYADTYEAVLQQSKYFKDGLYDYANAFKVQKSLKDNNFMKRGVGNKVIIVSKDSEETIVDSEEKLNEEYEKDKNRIFDTLEKQVAYYKFDNEISANPDLRDLRDWVRQNKELVPHLLNYKYTKKLVWEAHFASNIQEYEDLIKVYQDSKDEIDELIERSKDYESEWIEIVDNFKASFRPKFDIKVSNKVDVVLKRTRPELVYVYHDDRGGAPREVDIDALSKQVFSTGERRALYILCMMFEIKARIMSGEETVVVLDDVADSFDYKNKYAIIEYLHDLARDHSNNLHMIVLTHNYDFFRSLRVRCQMKYHISPKVFVARRDRGKITLRDNVYTDEFTRLKQETPRNLRAFLSLIPLARNIVEYQNGLSSTDYTLLTEMMHNKINSRNLTMNDAVSAVSRTLAGVNGANHSNTDKVQDRILTEADDAVLDGQDDQLEDKIILALATRLRAERHMKYTYVNDGKTLPDVSSNQTATWHSSFVADYPNSASLPILKLVNIVTPETLHINSFMYEPIVDMSIDEIKDLYSKVSALPQ